MAKKIPGLSTREAAARLGLSYHQLCGWRRPGRECGPKFSEHHNEATGHNVVRYLAKDLDAWAKTPEGKAAKKRLERAAAKAA